MSNEIEAALCIFGAIVFWVAAALLVIGFLASRFINGSTTARTINISSMLKRPK
jgi:hypothetical protein